MYTLFKNKEIKAISKAETPPLFIALIIAETTFHFGSFVFECAAFLITWFALSFVVDAIFPTLTETNKKGTSV